jgi:hypothetical protein
MITELVLAIFQTIIILALSPLMSLISSDFSS